MIIYYKKKEIDEDRVIGLCSKSQHTGSSHPLWDHVNEKLDDLYDYNKQVYSATPKPTTMMLEFWVDPNNPIKLWRSYLHP